MSAYDTYVTARLATYRQAWEEAGDPGGLQQAFWFCQSDRIPFPDWVLDGLNRLLHERCGTETERHRWLRNRKHVRRWQLVQELRQCTPADFLAKFGEPKNRANIFWAAAQIEAEEETDAVAFFNPEPLSQLSQYRRRR